ncbi:hypothetical protein UT300013_28170 [Paraclostridium sordellii]
MLIKKLTKLTVEKFDLMLIKLAQKYIDNKVKRIYNCTCYAYFEGKVIIFINGKTILKGGAKNEKNLSAKEKTKKKRAWI